MPIDRTSTSAITPFQDKSAAFMRRIFRYTGPASYVTGGESLPLLANFGIGRVYAIVGAVASNGTATLLLFWDRTNSKILWFDMAGAQVANATDLSAYSANLEAIGY